MFARTSLLLACAAAFGLGCAAPTVDPSGSIGSTLPGGKHRAACGDPPTSPAPTDPTDPTPTDPVPPAAQPTMHVEGRELRSAAGETVLLRGVNKMNIWTDRDGSLSFPQIRRAGANTVRIVWATATGGFTPTAADLDLVLGNALAQQLVPMIELHDATGNLAGLPALVDYWTRPDIVAVIAKREKWLLVNIGNEVGDDTVTTVEWRAAYETAVLRMRAAGIRTPLVIDAPDWGKNIDVLVDGAGSLQATDPAHNLLFSVHTYWPKHAGADAAFVRAKFDAAAAAGVPLIVGELSRYGAWAGGASMCSAAGEVDYQAVLEASDAHGVGWYAWEWGPGNVGGGDPLCTVMDMTTDDSLESLQPGWATEVVHGPRGLGATARVPASMP